MGPVPALADPELPARAARPWLPARSSWRRTAAGLLLAPSPAVLRRWALAGVITSALIILTGAAVRLSQSGLGCPDWPNCTAHTLGAADATGDSLIHRWIEFGNRLVTIAIFVVAVGVTSRRGASGRRTAAGGATCCGWRQLSRPRSCCRRCLAAWS